MAAGFIKIASFKSGAACPAPPKAAVLGEWTSVAILCEGFRQGLKKRMIFIKAN
jgi:hypothetical protein